jgi:hypothetical protein
MYHTEWQRKDGYGKRMDFGKWTDSARCGMGMYVPDAQFESLGFYS